MGLGVRKMSVMFQGRKKGKKGGWGPFRGNLMSGDRELRYRLDKLL